MATFYVLPPRPLFEDSLNQLIHSWMPGLPVPATVGTDLVDSLQSALAQRPGAFLVFREELPDGADSYAALRDGFGAELGDEVVELRLGARPGEMLAKTWRILDVSAA